MTTNNTDQYNPVIDKYVPTDEFKQIMNRYKSYKTQLMGNKLDLYSKTRTVVNEFKKKRIAENEMEQDAAEFDEVILEGVPIKRTYRNIKYIESDDNRDKYDPHKYDLLYESGVNFKPCSNAFNRQLSMIKHIPKVEKLYSPKRVNNRSLFLKEEEILPIIGELKKVDSPNKDYLRNSSSVVNPHKMKDIQHLIMNRIEKNYEDRKKSIAGKHNFRSLSHASVNSPGLSTNNITLKESTGVGRSILGIGDNNSTIISAFSPMKIESSINMVQINPHLQESKKSLNSIIETKSLNGSFMENNGDKIDIKNSVVIRPNYSTIEYEQKDIDSNNKFRSPEKNVKVTFKNDSKISKTLESERNNSIIGIGNESPVKEDKFFKRKVNNMLESEKTKKIISKISKEIKTYDLVKEIDMVQRKLKEKADIQARVFDRYKTDSDELKRRYNYIMKNKFIV
jgi:hypothetical protein